MIYELMIMTMNTLGKTIVIMIIETVIENEMNTSTILYKLTINLLFHQSFSNHLVY